MANGKRLGRPKGSLNSEYDKDIAKIKTMVDSANLNAKYGKS